MSDEQALRAALLDVSRRMVELGLNRGTAGNASVRCREGVLLTPSAVPVAEMSPASMVRMTLDGTVQQGGRPSSEWRFHCDIFKARPEIGAVLHMHSPFATTLACLRREVPAVHYMIALAGGDSIRCAPYSVFGEQQLSDDALEALQGRKACLLGNHGMIALGSDLDEALAVAQEVEFLCELYWRTLQAGVPQLLTTQQMHAVKQKFVDYKKRD
ncbi:class II aldolase/adducin family protein [Ferrigenium sp. UT5]|uniref:class II aldolase/adducin family protein n=1 Tax=Ferrigenium sp. UT5 TaxID=3242105 RepID=UPI00354F9609